MDGHAMQLADNSDPNQPCAATTEEQLAAQAREIQQLCEQLARATVKEGQLQSAYDRRCVGSAGSAIASNTPPPPLRMHGLV